MELETIPELFQQLGFWGTAILLVMSLAGGALSHYLLKWIDTRLERNSKIEEEIREIKRKRYEEFVEYLEKLLSRGSNEHDKEYLQELNLIYSKMAIFVPDEIVKVKTKEFDGYLTPKTEIEFTFQSGKIFLEKQT